MVLDKSSSQDDPRFISRRLQCALLGSRRPRIGPLRGRDRAVLILPLKITRHQKNIAVLHLRGQALVNEPAQNALRKTILRQSGSGRGGSAEEGKGVRFTVIFLISALKYSARHFKMAPPPKLKLRKNDLARWGSSESCPRRNYNCGNLNLASGLKFNASKILL